MRILFVGDTHMNRRWWKTIIKMAQKEYCDFIIQVGDFGFFPTYSRNGEHQGMTYLTQVATDARAAGIPVVFIKGNHEDHDQLAIYEENGARSVDNFVDIAPPTSKAPNAPKIEGWLFYATNGTRFNWDGVEFGVLGGAFSVDYQGRTPGLDWFPGLEEPNDEDVANLGDDPVDVLICHDSPAGTKLHSPFNLDVATFNAADRGRQVIKGACRHTSPSILVHGHWHQRKSQVVSWISGKIEGQYDELPWESCVVESLGKDGNLNSLWVFDTEVYRKENEGA